MKKSAWAVIIVLVILGGALLVMFLPNEDEDSYQNVKYGAHERNMMDIYLPDRIGNMNNLAPVFLYVHGGGWTSGDKTDGAGYRDGINSLGCILISVNYRLINDGNDVKGSDMLDDIGSAISFLAANSEKYFIDPSKMAIGGDSAGAHLSMLYAYSRTSEIPIKFVMSGVGPADLTDPDFYDSPYPFSQYAPYLIDRMAGTSYGADAIRQDADRPEFRAISPIEYVAAGIPPTVLAYGVKDELVPFSNAERMEQKMDSVNAVYDMFVFGNSGHSLESPLDEEARNGYYSKLLDYFKTYLL